MEKRTNEESKLKNTESREIWLDENTIKEVSTNSSPAGEKEEMNEIDNEEASRDQMALNEPASLS